jgi:hypothetical protein
MAATQPPPFPERAHISAIALQLQSEQEKAVQRWARWARKQVAQWDSATDPGDWDARAALDALAR